MFSTQIQRAFTQIHNAECITKKDETPLPQNCFILNLSNQVQQNYATAETATREARTIQIGSAFYYVKNINYGNQRAAEEFLMAKYMMLTGLPTPKTYLGTHCDGLFNHSHHPTRRDLARMDECGRTVSDLACVVSQIEPTFKDLGRFLLEDGVIHTKEGLQRTKYEDYLSAHNNAYQKEKELLAAETPPENRTAAQLKLHALIQSQPEEWTLTKDERQLLALLRQAKKEQLNALHEMYRLLPDALHKEIELAFYASQFIGNNDFLNFSLYNTGFIKTKSGALRAMVIDYGNCGPSGYKGKYIEDSLDVAKQRARIQDPIAPNTFIQKSDLQFSTTQSKRARSQSTNDMPQPGNTHHDLKLRSQSTDSYLGLDRKSITSVGSIPRARPFTQLFRTNIQAETHWVIDGMGGSPSNVPKELGAAIEVAYRLSLIPEPMLLEVAQTCWPVGTDARFPFFDPHHPSNLNAEEIANVMQERRNAYLRKFTPNQIQHWVSTQVDRAQLAYHEVTDAIQNFSEKIKISVSAEQS